MKSIAVKGIKMTKEDAIRFNKLKGDFNEIKTNSLNMANITGEKAKDGIPFLPLYGKENWGSHALKIQLRTQLKEEMLNGLLFHLLKDYITQKEKDI
jgi:hypothetical protein